MKRRWLLLVGGVIGAVVTYAVLTAVDGAFWLVISVLGMIGALGALGLLAHR